MSDLKIRITLSNSAVVLDSQTIQVPEESADTLSSLVFEALKAWTLAPGDTIKIDEA
jgi:hypothetical protein